MKHASTRALFEYWDQKRGRRAAPDRSDIDPAEIRHVLGDTFMLAADFADDIRFRLAGTKVCALFTREIKGEAFNAQWSDSNREHVAELLDAVITEKVGAVAGIIGRTENGDDVELELLLLPLAHAGHGRVRALGVLTPLAPPYWLGEQPVVELELKTLRHLNGRQTDTGAPEFGQPRAGERRRHGFQVYTGGRGQPADVPANASLTIG
jgi:hypothetical protein